MGKASKTKKGFTLIELLVVVSIIALLLSILMPSLQKAKEVAKRVVGAANQGSIVKGVNAYSVNYNGKVPVSGYNGGDTTYNNPDNSAAGDSFAQPWAGTLTHLIDAALPFGSHYRNAPSGTPGSGIYGLGQLYETGIIEDPETFYCPAVPKSTRGVTVINDYIYRYEEHVDSAGRWPYNSERNMNAWGTARWICSSAYYYNPLSKVEYSPGCPAIAVKSEQLNGNSIMGFDMILAQGYMPHRRNSSGGVNAFYGDGHVEFRNNKEAFDYIFDDTHWRSSTDNFNHKPELYATFLKLLN